jgi:hypothetical protein
METRYLDVDWPAELPLPIVGDNVDCLAGADPLGIGFQVDARTILLEGPPYVLFTQFSDLLSERGTTEFLDRMLEDVPGDWRVED